MLGNIVQRFEWPLVRKALQCSPFTIKPKRGMTWSNAVYTDAGARSLVSKRDGGLLTGLWMEWPFVTSSNGLHSWDKHVRPWEEYRQRGTNASDVGNTRDFAALIIQTGRGPRVYTHR